MEIAGEEIYYLIERMAEEHEERNPGWYTAIAILSDRYPNDSSRTYCISERMRCLTKLVGDSRMKGWTIAEDGCTFTHAAIFHAMAKCPLRANMKRVWFDPDEFFSIALQATEAEGRAERESESLLRATRITTGNVSVTSSELLVDVKSPGL